MASSIKPEPLLSERTLRYGRAITIWGSISLVFLYLPGIDLNSFSPFGLKFGLGNERWVWLCIFIVIIYNLVFFAQGFFTDRLHYLEHEALLNLEAFQNHRYRSERETLEEDDGYVDENEDYFISRSEKFYLGAFKAYKLRLWIELPIPVLIGASSIVGILIRVFNFFA